MVSIDKKEIAEKPQNNDNEVVLSVNGVSKRFCRDLKKSLFYGVKDIASELIGVRGTSDKLRDKEFWALNDVSFQLRRGEALGLVGKNGSGKSTLLRIIAGLIKPDAGTVEVNGRIAPLIALGAGFNPILTGRENIYANMSILGLSKKEIDERFDEVLEFAEIGDAIDSPVRSYSSGMAARLGFASAIHTEPDILLIDEVLAVGDVKFRTKCYRKLQELRSKGTSLILVTHSSTQILNACQYAIYLSKGSLIMSGEPYSVVTQYEEDLFQKKAHKSLGSIILPEKSDKENLGLHMLSLFFRDGNGNPIKTPIVAEPTQICIRYRATKKIENLYIYFWIKEQSGESDTSLYLNNFYDGISLKSPVGEFEAKICLPHISLKPGLYSATVSMLEGQHLYLDVVESFKFRVDSKINMSKNSFYQPHVWKIEKYEK